MCNTTATRRPKLHVFYFGTAANLNANKRWNRKKKTKTKTTDNDDDENFQRQNVLCACSRCQAPVRGRSRKCRNRCCCSFATMHVWFVILVLFFFFFALLSIGHNMRAFIAPFITIERTELRSTCDGPSSHIIFFLYLWRQIHPIWNCEFCDCHRWYCLLDNLRLISFLYTFCV